MDKKTKDCPFCWEEILETAKKCKHCGEFLEKKEDKSEEPKKEEPKKKSTRSIFFLQLLVFFIVTIILWLSLASSTFIWVILSVCWFVWYCYCSKKDNWVFDFKAILNKERLKSKPRMITAIIWGLFFLLLTGWMLSDWNAERKAKANAPEVIITMITQSWDVWDAKSVKVEANIEWADSAVVNWEDVEIVNWKITKEVDLDIPQKWITIIWKNKYNEGQASIIITRNENEKEKADRLEIERIEAEKKAEQDKLAKEKESKINALKAKCRVKRDDFEKITWYATKSLKEWNNQNSIDLYIWVDDNWDVFPRLRIRYYADSWLFVNNYQFLFWENVLTYTPWKVERDNAWWMVWEWSDTFVWADEWKIINWITSYDNPTIRYNWSKYRDDRVITQKEIQALKDMKELYLYLTDQLI